MTVPARDTGWLKSTRSGSSNQSCVEVRITDAAVRVRDSKNRVGPSFTVPTGAWIRFVTVFKDDQLE